MAFFKIVPRRLGPLGSTPLFSLVLPSRPASYNNDSPRKRAYAARLVRAFRNRYFGVPPQRISLYSRVYHFYFVETRMDADNISKPTLDSLNLHAYRDDFQVKIRAAGGKNLGTPGIHFIDVTDMDSTLLPDFISSLATQDHTVYIEIGDLNDVDFVIGR